MKMKTYDVWTYDGKGNARRVARVPELREVKKAVEPFRMPDNYVYVLVWNGTECKYVCGWLAGQLHTNDLRSSVRNILRG